MRGVKVARDGGLYASRGDQSAVPVARSSELTHVQVVVVGVEVELGLVERGSGERRKLGELVLFRGCSGGN